MSEFYVTRATPRDDPDICQLLSQRPMGEHVRITLERQPSPEAAARAEGYRHATVLVRNRADHSIVGMGSRVVRQVYYNGEICRVGYLANLRAAENRRGLKRLVAGYEGIHTTRDAAELPFDLTSIAADNLPARRLLQKGLQSLPGYRPLAELSTFILTTGRYPGNDSASLARPGDLPEIVALLNRYNRAFQFAHVYTEQDLLSASRSPGLSPTDFIVLREHGRIVACLALWDQRAFKQIVVKSYAHWLRLVRPLLNLGRTCLGKPRYPRAPHVMPIAFLSHFAMPEPDPDRFAALIGKARQLARSRGIRYLATGFCESHPCHEILRREYRHQQYRSTLFSVHWRDQPISAEFNPEARMTHPEVALL